MKNYLHRYLQKNPSALQREQPALLITKFLNFFLFCGTFLSSWIWIPNLDPDLQTQLNPDPIQIRNTEYKMQSDPSVIIKRKGRHNESVARPLPSSCVPTTPLPTHPHYHLIEMLSSLSNTVSSLALRLLMCSTYPSPYPSPLSPDWDVVLVIQHVVQPRLAAPHVFHFLHGEKVQLAYTRIQVRPLLCQRRHRDGLRRRWRNKDWLRRRRSGNYWLWSPYPWQNGGLLRRRRH